MEIKHVNYLMYSDSLFKPTKQVFYERNEAMTTEIQNTLWKIDCNGYYPYCPNCRYEPYDGRLTKFCPNCGKDLRKENPIAVKTSRQIIRELRLKSKSNQHEELFLSAADKMEQMQNFIEDMIGDHCVDTFIL